MRIAVIVFCTLLWMGGHVRDTFVIQHKEIIVKGKTSIGSFECSYDNEQVGDTLFLENHPVDNRMLDFMIPVKDFGCGNFLLNSDFRSTLKAEEYPICLVSVDRLIRKKSQIFGDVSIELAGKKMALNHVVFDMMGEKLQGKVQLSFEQLELVAPSRMGGLIKVEEILDLEINLYLDPA